jgi:nucleoside-diphosphate-sugar epimerase
MRVLVIGGTGFIGPAVVRLLAARDHEVAVFHRGQTTADLPKGVQHILGNRELLVSYADAFAHVAPAVVLDMHPLTREHARLVMQTVTGITGRVVAISSQDVYRAYARLLGTEPGPPDPVPLTEDAPLRERLYPYRGEPPRPAEDPQRWADDYDKILVERAVLGAPALPGTILRLPMIYGPRDEQHRLFPYLKRMDDGRPAILLAEGPAKWRWTRGYVENVAHAVALAVVDERAAGRIYNVGEETALSSADWVRAIGRHADWTGEVRVATQTHLPKHLASNTNTAQNLVTDSTRIRADLGYRELVGLDEALDRTTEWERTNPPAQVDPAQFDYAAEDAALAALDGPF